MRRAAAAAAPTQTAGPRHPPNLYLTKDSAGTDLL